MISSSFSFNPNSEQFKKKEKIEAPKILASKILKGDRIALSKVFTLLESNHEKDTQKAQKIIHNFPNNQFKSIRIGISGVPGVGKSSFIDVLGKFLIEKLNKKVAVLAIDPSSKINKGSILGDKTRMKFMSQHPNAFVRPSANKDTSGGINNTTLDGIMLCEAAGFDVIIVESVGVGQSEIDLAQVVDFFVLLMLANSGDELQGIKRGILEWANLILINKADGNQLSLANEAKINLESALNIVMIEGDKTKRKVLLCSAKEESGIDDFWREVELYLSDNQNIELLNKRKEQLVFQFQKNVNELILAHFWKQKCNQDVYDSLMKKISSFELSQSDGIIEMKKYISGKNDKF